jgi:hypothetical protein
MSTGWDEGEASPPLPTVLNKTVVSVVTKLRRQRHTYEDGSRVDTLGSNLPPTSTIERKMPIIDTGLGSFRAFFYVPSSVFPNLEPTVGSTFLKRPTFTRSEFIPVDYSHWMTLPFLSCLATTQLLPLPTAPFNIYS